ncbi:MAG TPA: DUF3375 domain-containing protein [Ignavibacteriales bacterium]|nr:DUF3375 domain-containing protein [Ignavibacteriales bacterium]
MKIDFEEISYLEQTSPAIKLFKSDNFPLIASFLFVVYKEAKKGEIPDIDMETYLSDYIYGIKQSDENSRLSDNPKAYLERWTNDGFLRKYYPGGSDIPFYQLTPASEKALQWIMDLEKKEFIGTESRLLKIFELLKEIVYKSTEDPLKRLEELQRRKDEIDSEIQKVKSGEFHTLDDTQIKERYYELTDTARKLLADFREIEFNFRTLDRQVREKQLNQGLSKGKLLEDVFGFHDLLWSTDQGKSFKAFWEFLMSPEKQEELEELSEIVMKIPAVESVQSMNILERLKVDLVEAGDKVNKTTHGLIEQLRKYLDSRVRLENRRIIEIIKGIKKTAVDLKDNPPIKRDFFTIEYRPEIEMIMERPEFIPPRIPLILDSVPDEGLAEIDLKSLYAQHYIDLEEIQNNIKSILAQEGQVSLKRIIDVYPVEKGLSEVMAYLEIAHKGGKNVINEENAVEIQIKNKEKNKDYKIKIPEIIFVR